MELEDIAKEEKFILFDTSINELDSFLRDIFPARAYSEMNYNDIISTKKKIITFMNFINYENIFTIEEVIKELNNLQEKLNIKAINFNEKKKKYKKLLIKKKKKNKISDKNQEEYNILLEKTHDLIQKAKKKIKKLEEPRIYKIIYNSVFDINKIFGLTENFNIYNNVLGKQPRIFSKDEEPLHTDEHLVATLFYFSLVKHQSYTLVTRDDGIFKLANKFNMLISADNSPNCKCLREMLIETPVKIYTVYPAGSYNYIFRFSSKDSYTPYEIGKEQKKLNKLKKKKKKKFEVIKF